MLVNKNNKSIAAGSRKQEEEVYIDIYIYSYSYLMVFFALSPLFYCNKDTWYITVDNNVCVCVSF